MRSPPVRHRLPCRDLTEASRFHDGAFGLHLGADGVHEVDLEADPLAGCVLAREGRIGFRGDAEADDVVGTGGERSQRQDRAQKDTAENTLHIEPPCCCFGMSRMARRPASPVYSHAGMGSARALLFTYAGLANRDPMQVISPGDWWRVTRLSDDVTLIDEPAIQPFY